MTADPLLDRELAALRLSRIYGRKVSEARIRQWAHRYPDELPRRGTDGRKVQHSVGDLDAIARRLLGDPPR